MAAFMTGVLIGYIIGEFFPWSAVQPWIINKWQNFTKKG